MKKSLWGFGARLLLAGQKKSIVSETFSSGLLTPEFMCKFLPASSPRQDSIRRGQKLLPISIALFEDVRSLAAAGPKSQSPQEPLFAALDAKSSLELNTETTCLQGGPAGPRAATRDLNSGSSDRRKMQAAHLLKELQP